MGLGSYCIIKAGSNHVAVYPAVGDKPTLEFLQANVGGWIESVLCKNLPEGVDMFCDEEGKLNYKAQNTLATKIFGYDCDVIVGDVIIVGHNSVGESIWLTDEQVKAVWEAIKR